MNCGRSLKAQRTPSMHQGDSDLFICRQYGYYLQMLVLRYLHGPRDQAASFVEINVTLS